MEEKEKKFYCPNCMNAGFEYEDTGICEECYIEWERVEEETYKRQHEREYPEYF